MKSYREIYVFTLILAAENCVWPHTVLFPLLCYISLLYRAAVTRINNKITYLPYPTVSFEMCIIWKTVSSKHYLKSQKPRRHIYIHRKFYLRLSTYTDVCSFRYEVRVLRIIILHYTKGIRTLRIHLYLCRLNQTLYTFRSTSCLRKRILSPLKIIPKNPISFPYNNSTLPRLTQSPKAPQRWIRMPKNFNQSLITNTYSKHSRTHELLPCVPERHPPLVMSITGEHPISFPPQP